MNVLLKSVFVIFSFAIVSSVYAEEATTKTIKTDWCEITSPVSIKPGEPFEVTVKVIIAEDGSLLKGDLHFFNADSGYAGFALWGGEGKEVKVGDAVTFKYTLKEDKGNVKVAAIMFTSKDGNYDNRTNMAQSDLIEITK